MKVLILDEMLPGKKGKAYCPFSAIEADISEEDCKFLDAIHGSDLTNAILNSDEDKLAEKYLNFIFDFSENPPQLRSNFKRVVKTDSLESQRRMGPYDRVFHVIY